MHFSALVTACSKQLPLQAASGGFSLQQYVAANHQGKRNSSSVGRGSNRLLAVVKRYCHLHDELRVCFDGVKHFSHDVLHEI